MKKIFLKSVLSSLHNSIALKLFALILVTLVPMTGVLIYINAQAKNTLLEQVENAHQNMLSTFMSQVDNQLNMARAYTFQLVYYENDPSTIALSTEEAQISYAKLRLADDMKEKLLSNNFIDAFFARICEADDYIGYITSHNSKYSTIKQMDIKDFVETLDNDHPQSQWQLCDINGESYLFETIGSSNSIRSGAMVSLSNLLLNFNTAGYANSSFVFISNDDIDSYKSSLSENLQMVTYSSSAADFSIVETFSRTAILESLPFMQKYTMLVSILLIIIVIVFNLLVYRLVIAPLFRLMNSMRRIQDGDLDYRIPDKDGSTEIRLINSTFNQMVGEVQHLKINIYEEQIKAQKSQLRNLQLQIKPHFLINSLNMVYNLIETQKLTLAQRLIQSSIDYFRYMVRVDEDLVPLNEEIDHIRAYLDIQSIRYKGRFTYIIDIDPMINDMLVPPVMIQGFVENSIKYGISTNQTLHIHISISSFEENDYPYTRIVISDNGGGYPSEDIERLNTGHRIHRTDGAHIGIYNITQRLRLLFGDLARWRFYNNDGAVSEIVLPATFLEIDD